MKTRIVAVVVAVALLASIIALSSHPDTPSAATPMTTHVVHATAADDAVLLSTFVKYKLATHGMVKTDHVKWSSVIYQKPIGPYVAYDANDHLYWALGNFALVLPASYAANVSFQDGGSYGIFYKSASGHWIMKGYAGEPLCANVVPAVVAHLWKLPNPPACGA